MKHIRNAAPPYAGEFQFRFEDLGIHNRDGFEAGLITGYAEISYWREDGYDYFFVGRIFLDAQRKATPQERADGAPYYLERAIEVDQETDAWLYLNIFGQLDGEGSWHDFIMDEVAKRLDDERDAA
jgi:hypothetical protein